MPSTPLNSGPLVISTDNLSHAWGRALHHVEENSGDAITPLIINLRGFSETGIATEDPQIREALDHFLKTEEKLSIDIVAFTIFPQRYWEVASGNRETLYQIYLDALPFIKAKFPKKNNRGLYFERLIDFNGTGNYDDVGNQLDFMLTEHKQKRNRTSKFQAAIFDPARDQNSQPYQTFPCLHSVSFVITANGLVVNGFYAMQYLVERGYGNLLGLSNLGAFIAEQMGQPLSQVNMFAGVEKLVPSKAKIKTLVSVARQQIPELSA